MNSRSCSLVLLTVFAVLTAMASPLFAQGPAKKDTLPPNFTPPPEAPKELSIVKELLTEEQDKRYNRVRQEMSDALKSNNITADQKKLMEAGAEAFVYRLSMKKYSRTLGDMRANISRMLNLDVKTPAARKVMLDLIIQKSADLLDNSMTVRIQATMVLSSLNLVEGSSFRKTPAIAYVPAHAPLLTVINDGNQHPAVKLRAAYGLGRILASGPRDEVDKVKVKIAQGLINELKNSSYHWAYHRRLVDALQVSDVDLDPQTRKPIVLQTLGEIIVSNRYKLPVRAQACRAVGRAKVVPSANMKLLTYEMAVLARDMAATYNKLPQLPNWKTDAFNIYLAFQPLNSAEQKNRGGLLSQRGAATAKPAYDALLPIVRHIINHSPKEIPASMLDNLNTWLTQNKPAANSIADGVPPLRQAAAPPASTSTEATAGP